MPAGMGEIYAINIKVLAPVSWTEKQEDEWVEEHGFNLLREIESVVSKYKNKGISINVMES